MKILVLANFDVGLYQFRRELLTELLKQHEVVTSLPYGSLVPRLQEMGCRFVHTPMERRGMNPFRDIGLLCRYIKLLRQECPDLVITYTVKPNVYGGIACRFRNIPYVTNITGLGTAFQKPGVLRALVTQLYKGGLKKAKTVFFENADNMQTFLCEGIVSESQCSLLNGAGVNLEHYRPTAYPEEGDTTRFLFVGRVMREKGIEELFSAMQALRKEGIPCTLDVLGECEENFQTTIDAYTKEGWLKYHGYQTDVRPYIADSHCFVLPSWHEGMANTNLECAAMARPVITSDIPGCREAVVPNESGYLCAPRSAESLAIAMQQFCELPREARKEMGLAGRKHMENKFDKMKVVADTIAALPMNE